MLKQCLLSLAAACVAAPVVAGELVVTVTNAKSADGEIGCALFSATGPFPTGRADVASVWRPADADGVTCRFTGLSAGEYAVATSHDLNGNRETDTNFLGVPREDWGVSNNVRPTLRAPTFEEAKVAVGAGDVVSIDVELGR